MRTAIHWFHVEQVNQKDLAMKAEASLLNENAQPKE